MNLAAASRCWALVHSRRTASRTSASAGTPPSLRSARNTTCAPYPDSTGPCHRPGGRVPNAAANFSPNRFATSRAEALSNSCSSRIGSPRDGETGLGAGLVQPDPQALGVARQVRAVALRIEIHLPKRESRFGGERGGMRRQVGLQFRIARLRRRGEALGNEFHLLLQAAADDEVVLVEAQRQRLAVIDFLPHPVPDQALQFLAGGCPLPGADEALRHGRDLALRDDDLSRSSPKPLVIRP